MAHDENDENILLISGNEFYRYDSNFDLVGNIVKLNFKVPNLGCK